MSRIEIRKGMPDVQIDKVEFSRRFRDRFFDPAFAKNEAALQAIIDTAWNGYDVYRKNPVSRVGGPAYSKPEAKLPAEWLDTRAKIDAAEMRQKDVKSPNRILLVNGFFGEFHKPPRFRHFTGTTLVRPHGTIHQQNAIG